MITTKEEMEASLQNSSPPKAGVPPDLSPAQHYKHINNLLTLFPGLLQAFWNQSKAQANPLKNGFLVFLYTCL